MIPSQNAARSQTFETGGLILNFIGGYILAASGLYGFGAGWGGDLVWNSRWWSWVHRFGWLLFLVGFVLQLWGRGYKRLAWVLCGAATIVWALLHIFV